MRGPHDMFQYIVRDLVTVTNVTNAAILYDDTFMMNHHFKNLLLDVPVRYAFGKKLDRGSIGTSPMYGIGSPLKKYKANSSIFIYISLLPLLKVIGCL